MAYLPQFKHDVYISYAPVDNLADSSKPFGWVDFFQSFLGAALNRRIGRIALINVWQPGRVNEEVLTDTGWAIRESAVFVALVSKGYWSSDLCRRELQTFCNATEGGRVHNHSRIFLVELQRIPRSDWPREFGNFGFLSYPFYETDKYSWDDPGYPEEPGGATYESRLAALAANIVETLELLKISQDEAPATVPIRSTGLAIDPPPKSIESPPPTKSAVFISYRRGESNPYAGRLYDNLADHFGKNRVFMDLDSIEPGDDFVEVITNYVSTCSILIALINRAWLDVKDEKGLPRLHNPEDFVHLEISIALQRNIRVIPVLVQGASMPGPQDLPESLAVFSRRNAIQLSSYRWKSDVSKLIEVLEKYL